MTKIFNLPVLSTGADAQKNAMSLSPQHVLPDETKQAHVAL